MKSLSIIVISILCLLLLSADPILAAGELRKLTGIANSLGEMEKVSVQEGKNYDKAKAFLSTPAIRKGLPKADIIEYCGQPVATVQDDTKWVYKPPSSTFFEGEKIYFVFDSNEKLASWEQVYQD